MSARSKTPTHKVRSDLRVMERRYDLMREAPDEFNRKQRRILKKMNVRLEDIKFVLCGWRGCNQTCGMNSKPPGWVNLIAYRGQLVLDTRQIANERWVHDKALCPQHAAAFDELLRDGSLLDVVPAVGRS